MSDETIDIEGVTIPVESARDLVEDLEERIEEAERPLADDIEDAIGSHFAVVGVYETTGEGSSAHQAAVVTQKHCGPDFIETILDLDATLQYIESGPQDYYSTHDADEEQTIFYFGD